MEKVAGNEGGTQANRLGRYLYWLFGDVSLCVLYVRNAPVPPFESFDVAIDWHRFTVIDSEVAGASGCKAYA